MYMITYDENILGYLLFLHTFPNVPKVKKMIDNWTIMPVARIYVMASLKAINSIPELLPA